MGGVRGMDDYIYGIPYQHDKWLKIKIVTETTSLFGDGLLKHRGWKYNGGVVGEYCNIYTILEEAENVAKFNTTTQKISKVGNSYDGSSKWTGGALHLNGYIYILCARQQ